MFRLSNVGSLAAVAVAFGCGGSPGDVNQEREVEIGARDGLRAETVVDRLNNPSSVTFSPDGILTICEAGPSAGSDNGRVVLVRDGRAAESYVTDFRTEFWKPGQGDEPDRFKLGPLSAVWLDADTLVVSNSGLPDGQDHLLRFSASGPASSGIASNGLGPTSEDPADRGEGNFTGLARSSETGLVYACGQGSDAGSWLLLYRSDDNRLEPLVSADAHGIEINSPMMALPWGESSVMVLYSGAGGQADGLLVQWDIETGKPVRTWTLPGLVDPMGMARIPATDTLAVVDNNWDPRTVKDGQLARVTLPTESGEADVKLLATGLDGPVSCAFGPDGRLYVALLGPEFDRDLGSVIAIDGIE